MTINCGLKSPTASRKVDSEGTEAVSMRDLRAIFFATPGPHLRSGYALTAMRAGCRASHWKRGLESPDIGLYFLEFGMISLLTYFQKLRNVVINSFDLFIYSCFCAIRRIGL